MNKKNKFEEFLFGDGMQKIPGEEDSGWCGCIIIIVFIVIAFLLPIMKLFQ